MHRRVSPEAPLRLGSWLLSALLLLLVVFCAAHPLYSPDLFWHLALGDVIREQGAIPSRDLFSAVEPERPYTQFNWLWEVIASAVHAGSGPHGVRLMQAASLSGSFLLLGFIVRRTPVAAPLAVALTALSFALFEDRFRARPDSLSLAFTAAMIPLWLRPARTYGVRSWGYAFALGLMWSNIHGGASLLLLLSASAVFAGAIVQAGLNTRAARAAPQPATAPGSGVRGAAGLWLGSALGVAASPTTLPGLGHWLTAIQPQLVQGNEEWAPAYTILHHGMTPAHVLVGLGPSAIAVLYGLEQGRALRRQGAAAIAPAEWLLCAGYLILAHQAVRNAFLCLLPLLFMVRRWPVTVRQAQRGPVAAAALLSAAALLGAVFQDAVLRAYGGLSQAALYYREPLSPGAYPVHAAAFLAGAGIEGAIINDGRWGGYLAHRLWPRNGVFVDTRHHLEGPMWSIFDRTHRLSERQVGLAQGFARYGLELAVFPAPTFPVRAPEDWLLLFKAGDEEVYQHRAGRHATSNLARAAAYLRQASGLHSGPSYAAAATAFGARAFLAEPRQRHRRAVAEQLLRAPGPAQQARGYRIRGKLWLSAGFYRQALDDYETALGLVPDSPKARLNLALCLARLGQDALATAQVRAMNRRRLGALSAVERTQLAALIRPD